MPTEADRQHDLCHAVAWQVLEIFRPLIRDEEARDAYAEIYAVARQEILIYERLKARRHQCPEQKEELS